MRVNKQLLKKMAIGIALVFVAGVLSFIIKDTLAMQAPENALPVMQVYFNDVETGVQLHPKHILRDSYSWRFLWKTVAGGNPDPDAIHNIEPAWVPAGAPLLLEFSFRNSESKVSMAKDGGEFIDLGENLSAPMTPGVYTYRVWAGWGVRGSVLYYFKIQVPGEKAV